MTYGLTLAKWGAVSSSVYVPGTFEFVMPESAQATSIAFYGCAPHRIVLIRRRIKQKRDNRKDRNALKMYRRRPGIKEGVMYYVTSVESNRFRIVTS